MQSYLMFSANITTLFSRMTRPWVDGVTMTVPALTGLFWCSGRSNWQGSSQPLYILSLLRRCFGSVTLSSFLTHYTDLSKPEAMFLLVSEGESHLLVSRKYEYSVMVPLK